MSENTRIIALHSAIQLHARQESPAPDVVVATAETLLAFLDGAATDAPSGKQPAAGVVKPAASKSAAGKPAGKPPGKTEEQLAAEAIAKSQAEAAKDSDGPTVEQVGAIVTDLLAAGKRNEAVALLGKFKAKSVSGVKPEDYVAFVEEGQGLLLSA